MAKLVAFVSTACLICLLIAIAVYFYLFLPRSIRQALDSPAVVKEVRHLNELVTVKYSIEKVVGMKEDRSPVGTESILLLVRGKVSAGVNLARFKSDDLTMGKDGVVRIRLGEPIIEDAYLDEKYTKVWDRSITWWTPWVTPDADLEHKARMQALVDIRAEATQMGILDEAARNAQTDIRAILQVAGIKQVVFITGT